MGLSGWMEAASMTAAGSLIAVAWQGLLLSAMVWICLRFGPKTGANLRFLAWMAVFLAILALPVLPVFMAHSGDAGMRSARDTGSPMLRLSSRWAVGFAALWLGCSLLRLARLIGNAFRVRSLLRTTTAAEIPSGVEARLRPLLNRAGFLRSARLCVSPEIDQPCAIGFFAPRVLVPDWLLGKATPAELEQIVLHEVAHLRRFDDWTNLFQKLALAAFPLNPGLAWAERRLCAEREVACDESVVRATRAPREYASCLANLAGQRLDRRMTRGRAVALSLGAWEKQSELARRIHGILRGGEGMSPRRALGLLAALALVVGGGAAKLAGSSQLVAFTPALETHAQRATTFPIQEGVLPEATLHDVAFREPAGLKTAPVHAAAVSRPTAGSERGLPEKRIFGNGSAARGISSRPAGVQAVPILRRAASPVNGAQAWIVISRWDVSSDQASTIVLIDQVFRISPTSAAPSSTGWFVVQL
jgi:beta-lactamase regulating signal transducer with metallopeptidase domain